MRLPFSTLLLASAALVTACGHPKPTIQINVSPQSLVYDPQKCAKVTVTGIVDGNPFSTGMDPGPQILTTDGALLVDPNAGMGAQGDTHVDGQVTGSSVILNLCPTQPGDVTVSASVADAYGDTANASTIVHFTAPMAAILSFSCKSKNIDAFENFETSMAVGCDASVQDGKGTQLVNADIQFLAEAGSVVPSSNPTNTGIPSYVYYPHQGKHGAPAKVSPFTSEPNWKEGDGTIHSPRQGLVTLVAYTPGPVEDTGDMFLSGEPFVDANDNGSYDLGEDFFDVNGDGMYNNSQAGFAKQYVWTQIKILWTGALSTSTQNPYVKAKVVSGNLDLSLAAPNNTVSFQLVDDNCNPLAANGSGDNITWQLSPDGELSFGAGQSMMTPMFNTFGMDIDPITYQIKNPTSAATYLQNTIYAVKLLDMRMPMDMMGNLVYSVYGTTNRTGYIDDMGNFGDGQSDMSPVIGGSLGD